jgi:hypothetical protein
MKATHRPATQEYREARSKETTQFVRDKALLDVATFDRWEYEHGPSQFVIMGDGALEDQEIEYEEMGKPVYDEDEWLDFDTDTGDGLDEFYSALEDAAHRDGGLYVDKENERVYQSMLRFTAGGDVDVQGPECEGTKHRTAREVTAYPQTRDNNLVAVLSSEEDPITMTVVNGQTYEKFGTSEDPDHALQEIEAELERSGAYDLLEHDPFADKYQVE